MKCGLIWTTATHHDGGAGGGGGGLEELVLGGLAKLAELKERASADFLRHLLARLERLLHQPLHTTQHATSAKRKRKKERKKERKKKKEREKEKERKKERNRKKVWGERGKEYNRDLDHGVDVDKVQTLDLMRLETMGALEPGKRRHNLLRQRAACQA
jgi:hypothetical protein